MHHLSVARRSGPGRPKYAGRDWHRAIYAWVRLQNLRMEYGHRGKQPGEFDTPYARALDQTARELGFGTRDPREALKTFLYRALKSAPPEVRAALPDHRELDAVFAKNAAGRRGER